MKCRYCPHKQEHHSKGPCRYCKCSGFDPNQVSAGEWIQPVRKGYRMQCCDCGLVHVLDFRIHRGRIQFRAFREAATGAVDCVGNFTVPFTSNGPLTFREGVVTLTGESACQI